jgi:ATP-binding cassette subfamily B protein
VVSQRVASVENADKIIVLDDGKVVGIGTDATLRKNCAVYKEICLSQASKGAKNED